MHDPGGVVTGSGGVGGSLIGTWPRHVDGSLRNVGAGADADADRTAENGSRDHVEYRRVRRPGRGQGRAPLRLRLDAGGQAAGRPAAAQRRGRGCASCSAAVAQAGCVVVVVDQPATIGALPVAVAQAMGLDTAYLPGLAMRRIADLHPGTAKTDARDAYVIADAARTLPHTLRRVDVGEDGAGGPVGADRLRRRSARPGHAGIQPDPGLLTEIHPALERVLGPDAGPPGGARAAGPLRRTDRAASAGQAAASDHRAGQAAPAAHDALWPSGSGPRSTSRPWSSPAPTAAETILPKLAAALAEHVGPAHPDRRRRRDRSSMPTLLPRS